MNFEQVQDLFDTQKADIVILTKTPRTMRMFELLDRKLLDITDFNVKAASLESFPLKVAETGAAFAVDANGSPIPADQKS